MLVKILIIAVFIALIMYVVLPKRRVPAPAAARPKGKGRLVLMLLTSSAMVLFILALFCTLLWLGGLSGMITGGGDVLGGTGLLRIGGVLFTLAIACAVAAWMKRPR